MKNYLDTPDTVIYNYDYAFQISQVYENSDHSNENSSQDRYLRVSSHLNLKNCFIYTASCFEKGNKWDGIWYLPSSYTDLY